MAGVMNHCHGNFFVFDLFVTRLESFDIAHSNVSWNIIDTVVNCLWNLIVASNLVQQVSEWELVQDNKSG